MHLKIFTIIIFVCVKVHDAENLNPQTLFLKPVSDGNTPSDIKKPLDDGTVVPLVIPVSVPVTATDEQARNKVGHHLRSSELLRLTSVG